MVKRSCKGSSCIGYLEDRIDEIDFNSDTSRNGKFNRAIPKAQNRTLEELKNDAKELKKFKNKIPSDVAFPTALQVTVDEELEDALTEVEENIMSALNLTTLQTKYEIELIWFIYLCELQKEVMEVGEKKAKEEDLTGPEMVKILVEILMLNREQDKKVIEEVKSALLKWEV
ncbi:hypothetical protein SAMN02910353_00658 [Ruminococcus sp. YRD2003]|uniref:hypothetical protein n=1 Tax=Ruminococcus sp. YRD2003 TaxID=1452313 RepID=UPI0008D327F1|nr:hypothetical protein SAMN02910353_00658 [Ruminococcus flavefaciens]